jgi:hypothetical protein
VDGRQRADGQELVFRGEWPEREHTSSPLPAILALTGHNQVFAVKKLIDARDKIAEMSSWLIR